MVIAATAAVRVKVRVGVVYCIFCCHSKELEIFMIYEILVESETKYQIFHLQKMIVLLLAIYEGIVTGYRFSNQITAFAVLYWYDCTNFNDFVVNGKGDVVG